MSVHRPHVLIAEFTGWRSFWLEVLGWGRMWVNRPVNPYVGERWAFDNAAFIAWSNERAWDESAYLRRLDAAYAVGRPMFAVVPDKVACGLESLDFSIGWLDRLPADWPWYLAVQDGMTPQDVSPILDRFDGLFLGGSDAFKSQAWLWCEFAHQHGKQFHYGRCGTLRKLDIASKLRADSIDSSFPLWTDRRFWLFAHRWMKGDGQQTIFGDVTDELSAIA